MPLPTYTDNANSPTLKRSFFDDVPSSVPSSPKRFESFPPDSTFRSWTKPLSPRLKEGRRSRGPERRPSFQGSVPPSMPLQNTARSFTAPMPSFLSVVGDDADMIHLDRSSDQQQDTTSAIHVGKAVNLGARTRVGHANDSNFSIFHQHRDSTSTSASESTDSSPTTTISTMDSSSATDPSPGSSPESPLSKPLPGDMNSTERPRTSDDGKMLPPPTPFFELQRPTTPAKKPRNLKNLAVDTSTTFSLGRAVLSSTVAPAAPQALNPLSAPASPMFVKPATPPRRKNSNLGLTIQTAAQNAQPPPEIRLAIPPTPGVQRPAMLRHFQSSPSLPLRSPAMAPPGGMQLPPLRMPALNTTLLEADEDEPNFDIPQSREEKPAAYPAGPICIYEPCVYLYFEPTVSEARQYDVIMNVASEVKNPFTTALSPTAKDLETRRRDGAPVLGADTRPKIASGEATIQSPGSPTTPKADPFNAQFTFSNTDMTQSEKQPEYIHVPWEHNTDIVPDLYHLVKTIDSRVQEGKTVLIHCQCGVSRSASLIVAYGLYKNPNMSVQEAYDAVKKRSKWISPNMNLIMQLQEFRSGLLKQQNGNSNLRSNFGLGRRMTPGIGSATSAVEPRFASFDIELANSLQHPPRTAPLPPEDSKNSPEENTPVAPGPSSAPSGMSWNQEQRSSWGPPQSNLDSKLPVVTKETPYVDAKGGVVPVLSLASVANGSEPQRMDTTAWEPPDINGTTVRDFGAASVPLTLGLPPRRQIALRRDFDLPMMDAPPPPPPLFTPRTTEFHMHSLKQDYPEDAFGLTSPRQASFPSNLFDNVDSTPTPITPPREFKLWDPPSLQLDEPAEPVQEPLTASRSEPKAVLLTPVPKKSVKGKFSSPNMRSQIQLHKMQQEIESQLPSRSPVHPSARGDDDFDDLDALMSPRATEFTNNPFHWPLPGEVRNDSAATFPFTPVKDTAQPKETAKEGSVTPKPQHLLDEDPRSPAAKGASPITRNIWDFLRPSG